MDGPQGHYAKWNKSDIKTNTIWAFLYENQNKQTKKNPKPNQKGNKKLNSSIPRTDWGFPKVVGGGRGKG